MLTAPGIRALRPAEKPYKRFDEKGLYLLVTPTGSRLWRFKYRYRGRENHLALGAYPEVTLREARDKRDAARELLRNEVDPAAARRAQRNAGINDLKAIAIEWLDKRDNLAPITRGNTLGQLEANVFPYLGNLPIAEIDAAEILRALRRIEARGHHETAHRVRQRLSQIFRYAVATGRASRDPTADLRGALRPIVTRSRSAITDPQRVGQLLRSIEAYPGYPATRLALELLALTFVRPGELRLATWPEVDLQEGVWRIPGERMKMKREHLVPLSRAAVAAFRELLPLTGHRSLIFESLRPGRPMSENTVNMALRGMGYAGDEMTAHGFRAMASTLLHEQGWPPEVIELQLAHAQRNQVAAAYNRSARLEERKRMMDQWADYLAALRGGTINVIAYAKEK
ncbi:MAG: tyrosine-type recombinase/integrase [Proteobacteria bacterium]|nr:tyrosine-type recombinase/integrase [Pseudomonadota bacterium]